MTLDIKICGLRTTAAVDAAVVGGATHIGFIFFEKSPRHIGLVDAARLQEYVRGKAMAVAVTVDAVDADLDDIVETVRPDILQFHGKETPARVAEVKTRYGLPVMKALSISERTDLDAIALYRNVADRVLLDAKAPKDSELPGGNGFSFDWRLLATLDPAVEYMLSGGLNARNIQDALRQSQPSGIDISSGVESAPGVKDPVMIAEFFEAVKAARAGLPTAKELTS